MPSTVDCLLCTRGYTLNSKHRSPIPNTVHRALPFAHITIYIFYFPVRAGARALSFVCWQCCFTFRAAAHSYGLFHCFSIFRFCANNHKVSNITGVLWSSARPTLDRGVELMQRIRFQKQLILMFLLFEMLFSGDANFLTFEPQMLRFRWQNSQSIDWFLATNFLFSSFIFEEKIIIGREFKIHRYFVQRKTFCG